MSVSTFLFARTTPVATNAMATAVATHSLASTAPRLTRPSSHSRNVNQIASAPRLLEGD